MLDEPTADGTATALGMRATGFLLTVAGSLIAGVGAMLEWVVVTVPGFPDRFAPSWRGADVAGGRVVLGAAILALVAVLVTRVGGTSTARRGAAIAVLIAGIAIVAMATREVLTAEDRYATDAIAEARDSITSVGIPTDGLDEALDGLRDVLDVRLGLGVWLSLAGGLVVVAGGGVTLAWASRATRTATPSRPGVEGSSTTDRPTTGQGGVSDPATTLD